MKAAKETHSSSPKKKLEVFKILENHTKGKKGVAKAAIEALTEVLSERGGEINGDSYFQLILSSLKGSNEKEIEVQLFILQLLFPEVSRDFLLEKFDKIVEVFSFLLNKYLQTAAVIVNVIISFFSFFIIFFFLQRTIFYQI